MLLRNLLCVALAVCISGGSATAAPLADASDVNASLATYVASYPHAEVIIGVVDGTTTAVYAANGSAAKLPGDRSVFQIGSVTKTFTATLLAAMVQAKEVRLDDPIAKYLPLGIRAPEFEGQQITLESLAEQNSGLPSLPANFAPSDPSNPYAGYTTAQLYQALSQTTLMRAPGAQYEYSNFGVALLGQLLADRMHESYPSLLETRVLKPLGMNDTAVVGTPASRTGLVPGYATDGSAEPPWDIGSFDAAGSIESDLHDMLIYLKANMAAPSGVLGNAMADAQAPRFPVALNGLLRIGLIWQTNTRSGITWHNGETGGYHAFIGFDRAAAHGVVVLANVADMQIDQLAVHVLAPYVPAPVPVTAANTEPSPYSGVYRLTPSFAITIFARKGSLYAQGTGQPALKLTSLGHNAYAVQGVDAQITFELDSSGKATALTLHQNGIDQHAEKSP
jgi:serine-type D-Ala-D-Ala carboxypeptidase/endopeptidase